MTILGVFGLGAGMAIVIDIVVQGVFKTYGGKHLKRNNLYHLFSEVNLFFPVVGGFITLLLWGSQASLEVFFVSAGVGTFCEYALGKFLLFMHGTSVWEYQYLPIGKFTSWISIAYWGAAGLLFVKIANLLA